MAAVFVQGVRKDWTGPLCSIKKVYSVEVLDTVWFLKR